MAAPLKLLHDRQWVNEAQDHTFPALPLYDDKGVLVPSVGDLWLSLYDAKASLNVYINGLEHTPIKSTARAKLVGGSLTLTLTKDDLAVVNGLSTYTERRALVEYTYGTGGAKTGTAELWFVIRHIARFPMGS